MAKYKVITLAHLCKNNHLAKYGDIIDESQLTSNSNELVNAKFIELVVENGVNQETKFSDLDLDQMKKEELISFAKSNNFKINIADKKSDILLEIDKQIKDLELIGEVVVKP